MPAFDYQAIDAKGKKKKGSITADSEKQVRRLLKEQGLFAEKVSLLKSVEKDTASDSNSLGSTKTKRPAQRTKSVSRFQLAMVLRQIGVLINSGLPLDAALKMTVEQAESEKERRMGEAWRAEISEGRSFSSAMSRSPYKIPDSVVASVGVGEETGHLHSILIRLADDLEVGAENQRVFARGLIYPSILVFGSIFVVSFMMVWVVPNITQVFISARTELPLITQIIVAISNFTRSYGIYLLGFLAIISVAFQLAMKKSSLKQAWHARLLRVPGVGKWMMMANVADWSRSLGTLLQSGVPALSALGISSTVVTNMELKARFEMVTESMRRGSSLHNALKDSKAGSGFLIHMVGSGEASSELSAMLLRVADFYRTRLSSSVDTFLKVMNPVLIVFIGLVILVIVLAVMLPIIEMNDLIG
jgi:general secretion pathway protein F